MRDESKKTGQLNPTWVAWLMGWPIGFESLDPLAELLWLDWSVDPADLKKPTEWLTPRAHESAEGSEGFVKRNGDRGTHCSGSVSAQVQRYPATTGPIPRVATCVKDRVSRLKALGNGQVPQCAAAAWRILTEGIF